MYQKSKDIEVWERWNRSKSTQDLSALYKQTSGIIHKEVNRWQGVLSRPVLEAEARKLALQAFKSYDPNRGTALTTHLTNYLQKLSRIVYTHQNVARIPEYQTLKINTFQKAQRDLEEQYDRPPTQQELSEHLGWSGSAVNQLQRVLRSELIESREHLPIFGGMSDDGRVDLIYHDLTPTQKLIFEHSTGYGGKETLSNPELMQKLNMTQGQLSYEKRKIITKIKGIG